MSPHAPVKKLVIAALGSATLVLNPLAAFAAGPTIEDAGGPLVQCSISGTLNCSINYRGDGYNRFFNSRSAHDPADCGTFLAVGSELFGPGELNSRAAASMGTTTWTPVSQSRSPGTGISQSVGPRLSFAAVDSRSRRRTPTQRAMTTRQPRQ